MKIQELTPAQYAEIFSVALDGCDWLIASYCKEDYDKIPLDKRSEKPERCTLEGALADVLCNGGYIHFTDNDTEGDAYGKLPHLIYRKSRSVKYLVHITDFQEAMQDLYTAHLAWELLAEEGNADVNTAINFLQMVLFGEIVYA